jgi:hypothetical protein
MDHLDDLSQLALVLGRDGRIERVNDAWLRRGRDRGLAQPDAWLGVSYPDLCRAASGERREGAIDVAIAVEAVLAGDRQAADIGYACDAPDGTAWFTLAIRALPDIGGALLLHLATPDPRFLTDGDRRSTELAWRLMLGIETRCAWCARMAEPDGTWASREPRQQTQVSDGLCPACEARMVAEVEALQSAPA